MPYKISISTATIICLSAILGDTAFVVTGLPVAFIGPYSIPAYVVIGIYAALMAIELGLLGKLHPRYKGFNYSYVNRTFGTELGFMTGILLYVGFCAIIASVTFSFGGYLLSLLGIHIPSLQIAIAAIIILLLAFLNTFGLKETAQASKILVVITLLTISSFVAFAIFYYTSNPSVAISNFMAPIYPQHGLGPINALTLIVFAYSGFQVIASLTGNVKSHGAGIRKSMVVALAISIIVYIAITISMMALAPARSLESVSNPVLYVLSNSGAPPVLLIAIGIGILFSIAAATTSLILSASRIVYQMSRDGLLPRIASDRYDMKKDTPLNGIWITAIISILILMSGNLYTLISISNFGILFSWIMVGFAVINVVRRDKAEHKIDGRMMYIAALTIALGMYLMFGLPSAALALGISVILVLLVAYYIIVEITYGKVPRVRLFRRR